VDHTVDERQEALGAAFARVAAVHGPRPALASGAWQPTYRELDEASNRLAHALIARGGAPGERVAILMRHAGPQIAATLAALKAGCITVVLNGGDPFERIRDAVDHAGAVLVVADAAHRDLAVRLGTPGREAVAYEQAVGDGPACHPAITVSPAQPAFLVYTSGSTGRPKAVVRPHALVRQNAIRYARGVALQPDDRVALLASLSGGQGIGTMWITLSAGAGLCPFPFAERGIAALGDWLSERAITTYVSSASMFRSLARTLDAGASFPKMRSVRIASEMATAEDLRAFRAHFPTTCHFVHSFGCSEAGNIALTALAPGDAVPEGRLPVGPPADDLAIDLLDEGGRPVPPGEVGQIVVWGRHLALGYWRDPELTARHFSDAADARGLRSFRTGDRGRIDARGWIELAGRADSQVKVRGYRVEMTEVEGSLQQLLGTERVAVCALESPDGTVRLVAYVVPRDGEPLSITRLRRTLRAALPDHMVPTAIVAVADLPLTPHGKVDRARLIARHPPAAAREPAEPPQGETETRLAAIWADSLGLPAVGRRDDFFELGGDSLTAAVVGARVHDALGVELELAAFTDHPTLAALAAAIEDRRGGPGPEREPLLAGVARGRPVPLSFAQERIWRYSQPPGSVATYVSTKRYLIRGPLDREVLRAALDMVQRRHDLLRTGFSVVDGRPAQVVHPPAAAELPFIDVTGNGDGHARAEAFFSIETRRIADLARPPLMRFTLARLAPGEHLLFRAAHHLLGDLPSWQICLRELERAYAALRRGEVPPPAADPARVQYADYAVWQHAVMRPGGATHAAVVAWWRARLADRWPSFAPRFRRPVAVAGLDPVLGDIEHRLDRESSSQLDALAARSGATTYMVGLAALGVVLASEASRERIVIGCYMSGRNRTALHDVLGDFTTLVPLCLACEPDRPFRDWLAVVRRVVTETAARATIPYERLQEELVRTGVRTPEIGVIFATRHVPAVTRFADLDLTEAEERPLGMGWGLTVRCTEGGAEHVYRAHFDAGLYEPTGVSAMLTRLMRVLGAVARAPGRTLRELLAAAGA
jgi:amino acid adenylation domain-containing protein